MYDHGGMNRFYRLVWSEAKGCYVPIPEVSQKRGKRKGGVFASLAAAALALLSAATGALADPGPQVSVAPAAVMQQLPPADNALPTGGQVVGGSATISQSGNTQTINQTSQNAAIDWQSFDIGKDGKVIFNQPNASAIALNRVLGGDASKIYGVLQANGQVFLVNPNGVLFAKGAQVSAAAIMASTRDISVADFMAGKYRLQGTGNGAIVNEGTLTAAQGGYVALVGAQVVNTGTISAAKGDVRLVAANDVTIRLDTGGLDLTIDQGGYDALVSNGGVIKADNGRIYLTADAFDALAKASVNNSGIIEAAGVANVGGKVLLTGTDITLAQGSTIDASGDLGGGTVLVGGGWQGKDDSIKNASTVLVAPDAVIDVSARTSGDGGTAVLWSENRTGFYGAIKATGGAEGGNGGKVETSGHNQLQAIGSVDAGAANGHEGQWLLDPVNVTIASSGASGTSYSSTYNPTADSTILASSIQSSLNAGTNVTITTGSTGSSNGDITVNSGITVTGLTTNQGPTLNLLAAGDINFNSTISASGVGVRLNVTATADSDNNNTGNINFSSTGKVLTNGGNFNAGNLTGSGSTTSNGKRGQNFTMAAGSQVEVLNGMLDINVNGDVTLAANSLQNTYTTYTTPYWHDGTTNGASSYISVNANTITTTNASASTADIVSLNATTLTANMIGSASTPVKFTNIGTRSYATLTVNNTGGSSYINEIGATQSIATINVNIGSQASSTQNIQIMGNPSNAAHVLMNTDAQGVLQLATNDINTGNNNGTVPHATSVAISADKIVFGNGSVNTGNGTNSASFTATANTEMTGTVGGGADISSSNITLNGPDIGTSVAPVEIEDSRTNLAGTLTISNTGASTYLKVVNNGFRTVNLYNYKAAGSHNILFASGDRINYTTNGSAIVTPTISGGLSDGSTFGVTTGIDIRTLRNLNLYARDGDILFGDTSVNMVSAATNALFSANIMLGNATGVIAAVNTYDALNPVAQITGGNVTFSAGNTATPTVSTIGAGGKGIQLGRGAGIVAPVILNVNTLQGDVQIHEVDQDYIRNIRFSLGQGQATQSLKVDLKGVDDVDFSDNGSLIVVDPTKVNLSGYNRGFYLSASERDIRTDGNSTVAATSTTAGYYNLSGKTLTLNGDINTDGGQISLAGTYGVNLASSVAIDSNVVRTGTGGAVTISSTSSSPYNGSISATGAGKTLSVNTSSSDGTGGNISVNTEFNNRAGAYLGGLSLNADSATGNDGTVGMASNNILIDGNIYARGRTTVGVYQASGLIRSNASNGTTAGSITFDGDSLTLANQGTGLTVNASATGNGGVGGNVDLFTGATAFASPFLTVTAAGGTGGSAGDITLGAVTTTSTQSYTGSAIYLNGNLNSTNSALGLNGAVRVQSTSTVQSGAGTTTISGGVSAAVAGVSLTLGSGSDSAALSVSADNSGGHYLDTLTISSTSGRAVTLGAIGTDGTQTYTGGSVTIGGSLTTNGGNISLSGITTLNNLSGNITFDTDRAGGSNNAGQLIVGSKNLNGTGSLTIDTTADGGGANAALTLSGAGATTAFSGIDIKSGAATLNGVVRTSGNLLVEAQGATADITIGSSGRAQTTGTSNTVILSAGRNFLNSASSNTGIQVGVGSRYLVYSANPANSTEGMTSYNKHYNQTYTNGATPGYASSGDWFFYTIAPVLSVSSNYTSMVYGTTDPTVNLSASNYSGFIDGDTLGSFSGSQTLTLAAPGSLSGAGFRQVGTYAYTLNGTLSDNLGYQYAAFSENLLVTKASIAVTGISAVSREYDGTTNVTLTGTPSAGAAQSGDVVNIDVSGITGSITDKNVGNNKAVVIAGSGGLTGADAGNYQLTPPVGLTMDVTKKTLNVAGSTVTDKTYNGSNTATVTTGTLSGFVGSETVTATAAGTFSDKNAANGKSVTTTYTLSNGTNGGLASNYQLAGETLTGNIAKKTLNITGSSVAGKTYNGSDAATITAGTLTGFVGSETVTATAAGTFGDKNAGTGKSVATTYTLNNGTNGGLAANYELAGETLSGTIAKKTLNITGSAASDKTYDGSDAATVTAGTLSGFIGSETVTASASGSFADKNAGTNKSVTATYSLSDGSNGGLAANYALADETLNADIDKKTLNITGSAASNKTYDGSDSATVTTGTLSGFVGSETVTATAAGTFADKNAGTGKSVTTTYTLSNGSNGGLAANYELAGETVSADITKKTLAITGSTVTGKTYNGSDAATVNTGTLSGFVGSETVTASATGAFADKNAGTGKSVATTYSLNNGTNGGLAANYELAGETLSGTINQKALGISGSSVTGKTYDGTDAATIVAGTLTGLVGSESLSVSGSGTYADANAGTGKTVAATYSLSDGTGLASNYTLAGQSLTGAIAKKTLGITGSAVTTKTYDRSVSATITAGTLTGLVGSETLTVGASGSFGDWNAGTNKSVVTTYTLANGTNGGLASNYQLAGETLSGIISKKTISLTATGQNKTYNGSDAISVTVASADIITGDSVTFTGTGAASDKKAGIGKTVNVTGIASSSTDAANYEFGTTATTTADIAKKSITVAATGQNKTYDGSDAVGVTLTSGGIVTGDSVSFAGTGVASDKNAGLGKTVNVSGIGASGTDADNYDYNTTAATTADIAKKTVTVTATGQNKTYDGSDVVGVTVASADIVSGDNVSFAGTGAASDRNAGLGKTVNVTGITATGTDADNYDYATTSSTTADIAKKSITVNATGQNKTYDGSASVGVTLASTDIVSGDNVTFAGTGTASDKNAGLGKTVSVTGINATGTDADNYDYATTSSTTVDIAKKAVSVAAAGQNKTYDGSDAVVVSLTSGGIVTGDSVTFSGTGTASDKNAGTGKTVTVGNFAVTGTDADNYDVTAPVSTTVDIAKKAITVAAAGQNKTYDGSDAVGVSLTTDGLVDGDSVAFSGTGTASDKNAGTGKTVTVGGFAVTGTDAGNYDVTAPVSTTVDIAKKTITVAANGQNKTYDGQASVSVSLTSGGIVTGDTVAFAGTGTATDKNAGLGKTVNVTGIAASGTDADNYAYNTTASTTVDIAKKTIVVAAQGEDKVYDGSTSVDVALTSGGIVDGDTVVFAGTGTAADKNAGTGKTVAVTGIGATGTDAGNYAYNTTAATTADIAKKTISVDAQGVGRTYDATTGVGVVLTSGGIVDGDTVTFSGTGTASDKNAGLGKSVAVTGIAATGTDAGNYAYSTSGTTTVDIAKKAVTVQATAQNKTYDGSGAVQVSLSSNGIIAGDSVAFAGTGTASDKNAGTGRTVTVGNVAATGTDAGNYAVASTATTTVDIAMREFTVTLNGPIAKTGDGTTAVTLNSGNYQVAGLVDGEAITVNQTNGTFADAMAGKDKTVTAQIGTSNYVAGANTDLGNYKLIAVTLTNTTGEIVSPTSPGYDSAVNTAVTNPAVTPPGATHQVAGPAAAPAVSTGEGDNAVAAVSDGGKDQTTTITPVESREALTFRRTFAIADGGIRLPEGVSDTEGMSNE